MQGSVVKWHLSNASLNLFVISVWLDSDAGWLEQAAPALKPSLSVLLQAFVKITGARRVSHAFVPRFTPSKQQGQISRALTDTFSSAVVTFSTGATEKQTLQLELSLQSKGVCVCVCGRGGGGPVCVKHCYSSDFNTS